MKASIITFPGSNRNNDIANALTKAGAKIVNLWHGEEELAKGTDIVILPGGFSYGDYLRCGAIAAHANIMKAVKSHVAKGGYLLAICNGFQIACEAGLLPGILMRNADRKFICRFQHLKVERNDTAFASIYNKNQIIKVCIAHGEGNYVCSEETLQQLENEGRVAFRYCNIDGDIEQENPNGSRNAIAGIYSENFRVLGMMPHPENLIDYAAGGEDGLGLFQSILKAS